jgi:hypothetical protein
MSVSSLSAQGYGGFGWLAMRLLAGRSTDLAGQIDGRRLWRALVWHGSPLESQAVTFWFMPQTILIPAMQANSPWA